MQVFLQVIIEDPHCKVERLSVTLLKKAQRDAKWQDPLVQKDRKEN